MNARFLIAAALTLMSFTARAGNTTGTVVGYFTFDVPNTPPLFFFRISSTANNPAQCGSYTASQNRWVVRTDTPSGKANMVAILFAKATGQTLTITGKDGFNFANPCDYWGDTESVQSVSTN